MDVWHADCGGWTLERVLKRSEIGASLAILLTT